jgi:D-sedoheptulose 7-phosphate isomerase
LTTGMEAYRAAALRAFEEQRLAMERVAGEQLDTIVTMADLVVRCYRDGHKVIWCGNGGSAADAQHLSAELVGRYLFNRPPLPSLALHTDTSALTAIANDFGYDQIFSRQAEAFLVPGDILICLSTSGHSPNAVEAARVARRKGCTVLGLLGRTGGDLLPLCDHALVVPAQPSYVIQQVSMIVGHFLCDQIERGIFGPEAASTGPGAA